MQILSIVGLILKRAETHSFIFAFDIIDKFNN